MSSDIKQIQKIGLVSGAKVLSIFESIYPDILTRRCDKFSELVAELWTKCPKENPAINGSVFEGIIGCCLYRAGILPLFVQAKLAFIPNINFDFVAYSQVFGPIVLSAKTSLRERYKQADLEGMMMRQVHRKAKSYLLTLDEKEAKSVNQKISNGQVLGIDEVVLVNSNEFDELILKLQKIEMCIPQKVEIITGSRIIK